MSREGVDEPLERDDIGLKVCHLSRTATQVDMYREDVVHAVVRIAGDEAINASVVACVSEVAGAENQGGVHHDVELTIIVPVDSGPFLRACQSSQFVGGHCAGQPERSICIVQCRSVPAGSVSTSTR